MKCEKYVITDDKPIILTVHMYDEHNSEPILIPRTIYPIKLYKYSINDKNIFFLFGMCFVII